MPGPSPLIRYLRFFLWVAAALLATPACTLAQDPSDPQAAMNRAIADFEAGRFDRAVDGFDTVVRLVPEAAPGLWQRGIALYYARRWEDCRAQFELHRTVNPNDVENAVWHYLCVARLESPEAARASLLPVGPDRRSPMAEIYDMFGGRLAPDEVRAAAEGLQGEFYAHLYMGLYFEAQGEPSRAVAHIRSAAAGRYQAAGGYMHMVARVHLAALGE